MPQPLRAVPASQPRVSSSLAGFPAFMAKTIEKALAEEATDLEVLQCLAVVTVLFELIAGRCLTQGQMLEWAQTINLLAVNMALSTKSPNNVRRDQESLCATLQKLHENLKKAGSA